MKSNSVTKRRRQLPAIAVVTLCFCGCRNYAGDSQSPQHRERQTEYLTGLALSSNGSLVALGGDGWAAVLDIRSNKVVRKWSKVEGGTVGTLRFSNDSKWLRGTVGGGIFSVDLSDPGSTISGGPMTPWNPIVISEDGRLSAGHDDVFDNVTMKRVTKTPGPAYFSEDMSYCIVTTSSQLTAYEFDGKHFGRVGQYTFAHNEGDTVSSQAISGPPATAALWTTKLKWLVLRPSARIMEWSSTEDTDVELVAVSPLGKYVLLLGKEETKVLDPVSQTVLHRVSVSGPSFLVSFAGDGSSCAQQTRDGIAVFTLPDLKTTLLTRLDSILEIVRGETKPPIEEGK